MSRNDTVGSHKTTVSTIDGMTTVVYHQTAVVRWNGEKIILNSGGFQSVTTKRRMNQASSQYGLGFRVYQEDFEWFVDFQGKTQSFLDGMELSRVETAEVCE